MDFKQIIQSLENNQGVFAGLLADASAEEYTWRPNPESWCMLQVICHVLDEEREDFKKRMLHCLENPKAPFDPIDPQGWIESRKYMEQNYTQKVNDFLAEREASIAWLKTLDNPPLQNFHEHDHFGKMSAQFFLENWLAHDYLHIRQLLRLKNGYFRSQATESVAYAGNW